MVKKKLSGIYKITNKLDNKVYIGQSIDITRRYAEHFSETYCRNSHDYFHTCLLFYGFDNFTFEIIKETYDLDYWEMFFIQLYRSNNHEFGYNSTEGGTHGIQSFTEEIRQKMSNKAKERWQNPEERSKVLIAQNEGKQTKLWKEKRRAIANRMWANGEFKNQAQKLSDYWMGKPKSEETKAKMKIASAQRELKHKEDYNNYKDLGGKEPYKIFRTYYKKGVNYLLEELMNGNN